jgi:NADH:ubiquinone oxidoreductase subunit
MKQFLNFKQWTYGWVFFNIEKIINIAPYEDREVQYPHAEDETVIRMTYYNSGNVLVGVSKTKELQELGVIFE